MIDSREPYPEILRRSQQDAHQYRTGGQVIDRVTDRIWVFQNYHVVEIDAEGYNPRINNDASRKAIHQWLHTRSGVEWLMSGHNWPQFFEKYLTYMALSC